MKKLLCIASLVAMLMLLGVSSALAQQYPPEGTGEERGGDPPDGIEDTGGVAADDAGSPVAAASGGGLAATGLDLTVGGALAGGLVVTGAGVLVAARRRSRNTA